MIDHDKIDPDPIVAEVRKAREEIAAEFNYDLHAIFLDMQRRGVAANRKYADRKPLEPKMPAKAKKSA